MPVITIQRQYGAGGETIGAMVAQRLGAEFVDRKIFEEGVKLFKVVERAVIAVKDFLRAAKDADKLLHEVHDAEAAVDVSKVAADAGRQYDAEMAAARAESTAVVDRTMARALSRSSAAKGRPSSDRSSGPTATR